MNHTYEVFADIKEFSPLRANVSNVIETRYEIDAESSVSAYRSAFSRVTGEHPRATEYSVRVTRVLH